MKTIWSLKERQINEAAKMAVREKINWGAIEMIEIGNFPYKDMPYGSGLSHAGSCHGTRV